MEPRWHPCYWSPGGPMCGELLVSFAVSELDYNYMCKPEELNLSNYVDVREYTVNMLILGLRNLQSPGILPVKKAFIKFNIRSLLPPARALAVTNIQTEPRDSGPNPNINTTISFSTTLPVGEIYCPRLACEVFDQICKGFVQPKIGSFTIDVGSIM